jgi:hypothetical protein
MTRKHFLVRATAENKVARVMKEIRRKVAQLDRASTWARRAAPPAIELYRILKYLSSMKIKTSITLSASTIEAVDKLAGPGMARSRVIEQAVLEFVQRRRRQLREQRDLEILNRSADRLNREIEDVLAFQAEP